MRPPEDQVISYDLSAASRSRLEARKKATTKDKTVTSLPSTAVQKKTTKRKKAKTEPTAPTHWIYKSDPVHYSERKIQFTVRGNPLPLRRHRTSRGFMYNPSQKAQDCFRDCVYQLLGSNESDLTTIYPPTSDLVRVVLVFYMKRPNHHFRSAKRGPGRLRAKAPATFSYTRTDVDNLAKFVLDSLNAVCFVDDHQVVSLHVTKLYDNRGDCLGATDVYIERVSFESNDDPTGLWVAG